MQQQKERSYIAIDLKSFYASVECVERGLNPLTTNLVVADANRTEKTICLAVSPSLKSYGIGGRARLFEVVQKIKMVNAKRLYDTPHHVFTGKSSDDNELNNNPELEVDYITAPPRMALYLQYSKRIYEIYLKYVAPEDIHPYSVDEVFIDITDYLFVNKSTPHEMAMKMIKDVLNETGITATAGIGTNMYLCKIAMDIVAKHIPADKDGVRIAELDEMAYRKQLWSHRPITDFWRVGKGTATKLRSCGIDTMGKLARCSLENEDLLYKLFGINAELLIDHAWGWEPCTMDMVKAYKPETKSFSNGQVLSFPYEYRKARVVIQEMADSMALKLVSKCLVTNQITIGVGYDKECLTNPDIKSKYHGEIENDHYGRIVPKRVHGSINLDRYSSSSKKIMEAVVSLFDKIVNKDLLVRRLYVNVNNVVYEDEVEQKNEQPIQLNLFESQNDKEGKEKQKNESLTKERKVQQAFIDIKNKFGKNAVLRGLNFDDGATAKDRNQQIGGHKA